MIHREAFAMALIPLLGFALLMIYVLRWPDLSVEAFASANGLTLDHDTKSFVSFHLARMKMLRQWGAIAGFVAGLIGAWLFHLDERLWFMFVLVGSLVGMGMAEAARFFRKPSGETPRFAELERRDRGRYLSTTSRWVERAAIVAFASSAIIAVVARSRTPLWARIAVILTGAAVIVGGRFVGRRVAIRSVDPTNSERRFADEALRRAAVNVVVAIVASLTLWTTAWLLATPTKHTTLTVQFDKKTIARIENIGFPYEVSQADGSLAKITGDSTMEASIATGDSTKITWRDPTTGATRSTVVPNLPTAAAGDGSTSASTGRMLTVGTSQRFVDNVRDGATGAAGLLAFIAWLQVSRIPFRGRRDRPARRRLVGASA
jgi:hypothetical protein